MLWLWSDVETAPSVPMWWCCSELCAGFCSALSLLVLVFLQGGPGIPGNPGSAGRAGDKGPKVSNRVQYLYFEYLLLFIYVYLRISVTNSSVQYFYKLNNQLIHGQNNHKISLNENSSVTVKSCRSHRDTFIFTTYYIFLIILSHFLLSAGRRLLWCTVKKNKDILVKYFPFSFAVTQK